MVNLVREPTRFQVKEAFLGLISGRLSREDVADWANQWVFAGDPDVADGAVWDALQELSGADLQVDPDTYLHTEPDFHSWLDQFEQAIAE